MSADGTNLIFWNPTTGNDVNDGRTVPQAVKTAAAAVARIGQLGPNFNRLYLLGAGPFDMQGLRLQAGGDPANTGLGEPLTLVGSLVASGAPLVAQPGSMRPVLLVLPAQTPSALEGATIRGVTGANANVQRTVRFNDAGTVVPGHSWPNVPAPGDTFQIYVPVPQVQWGDFLDVHCDVQFVACDVLLLKPASLFFLGEATFTACRVDLANLATMTAVGRKGKVFLGAWDGLDPVFGNLSFGGCGSSVKNGNLDDGSELLLTTRQGGGLVLDGSLAKSGAIVPGAGADLLVEATDLANCPVDQFEGGGSVTLQSGPFGATVRFRADDPIPGRSGAAASIIAGAPAGQMRVTGLAGMDPSDAANLRGLALSGSLNTPNNGMFAIRTFIDPATVDVDANPSAVIPDAGPLAWVVYEHQFTFESTDAQGHIANLLLSTTAGGTAEGVAFIPPVPGDGITTQLGASAVVADVDGEVTEYVLRVGPSGSMAAETSSVVATGNEGASIVGVNVGALPVPPAVTIDGNVFALLQGL